jgi:hypothetical protein
MDQSMRVWLRPLGAVCRVRVESAANATWLSQKLGEFLAAKTSGPLHEMRADGCMFELTCSTRSALEQIVVLLKNLPGVTIMPEPE